MLLVNWSAIHVMYGLVIMTSHNPMEKNGIIPIGKKSLLNLVLMSVVYCINIC